MRIISVTTDGTGGGVATFDIANIGGTSSGTYYFTAQLPTSGGYTYSSLAQSSLAPSAHVVSTLRFSQAVSGVFSVSITTADANSGNNYASQTMSGSYNYNQPYPYQSQYSSVSYPYSPYTQGYGGTMQYQNYPYNYQTYPYSSYTNYNQYPNYTQQSPYSTFYPYAY